MKIKSLQIALKGICAYRDLCKTPLMERFSALLDALTAGQGENAVEHYTEVFCQLRKAGCAGLGGTGWRNTCAMRNRPMPCWPSGAGATPPWRAPPAGMWRPSSCWPGWTATS